MSYSQFSLEKALKDFQLTLREGNFLPEIPAIAPSNILTDFLALTVPLVSVKGSEKARSEAIVYPVLVEVKRYLDEQHQQVALFSGEEFNVDPDTGLNGTCDFLFSKSASQLIVEAPVLMVAEAKKADLSLGLGQCIAEMVAAQRYNKGNQKPVETIYGCVSSGTQWLFLKLEGIAVTVDNTEYPLAPIARIVGILVWMLVG